MKNIINRIGNKIILFVALILITNLNLSAQYKLEKVWDKEPIGFALDVTSITMSSNDSLIYVSSPNRILTIRTTDGKTLKIDTVEATYNLIMSRDGKTLAAAGSWGVGLLDPQTFKRIFWDTVPYSDFRSLSLNDKSDKIVITGESLLQKQESFLKIYDVKTKSMFKGFAPNYFGEITIKNASITDDGKYIIYGYETYTKNPDQSYTTHKFVTMIDLEGKLIKDFGETSSTKFTTTVNGKVLIYFDSKAMNFFDLVTMKEIEGISIGGADPENIEMSSDGKFMVAGYGGGLVYYDLVTKKSDYLYQNGTWSIIKINSSNSSLFYAMSYKVKKFNFIPTTSVTQNDNQYELTINIIDNKLILTNPQNHQINNLTAYDILGRIYPLSANGNEVDISALAIGKYFLKVGLADGSFLDFSFVKE